MPIIKVYIAVIIDQCSDSGLQLQEHYQHPLCLAVEDSIMKMIIFI